MTRTRWTEGTIPRATFRKEQKSKRNGLLKKYVKFKKRRLEKISTRYQRDLDEGW